MRLDEEVRNFFLDQAIVEMDAALQKGAPSPKYPVQAHDEWACVGVSKGLEWVDPIWAGADGTGHVFMYDYRARMSRPKPRELTAAMGDVRRGHLVVTAPAIRTRARRSGSLTAPSRFASPRAAAADDVRVFENPLRGSVCRRRGGAEGAPVFRWAPR